MQCEQAEKWIHKHVDHELPVKLVGELQQHLAGCDSCSALASEWKVAKAWFVPAEDVAIPEGFAHRVTALAFGSAEPERALVHVPSGGSASSRVSGGSASSRVFGDSSASSQGLEAPHRFLKSLTLLAAGLVAVLGLALYAQQGAKSNELIADDMSLDALIQSMEGETGESTEDVKPKVELEEAAPETGK